jgi:hypothetical protein
MADERENRIDKLSQRFRKHSVGRPQRAQRNRERHSFYLDGELVSRVNDTYKDVAHDLHPKTVNKSVFLETLLEYGLSHLADIQDILTKEHEDAENS